MASDSPQDFVNAETEAKGLNDSGQHLAAATGFSHLVTGKMSNGSSLGPARYTISTESFGSEQESGTTVLQWGKWWTTEKNFSDGAVYNMSTYGHYITGLISDSLPASATYQYSGNAYGVYQQ